MNVNCETKTVQICSMALGICVTPIEDLQIKDAFIDNLSDIQHINAETYHYVFTGYETESEVQSINVDKLSVDFQDPSDIPKYIPMLSGVRKLRVHSTENVILNYPSNVHTIVYSCELCENALYQLSAPVIVFIPQLYEKSNNNARFLVDPLIVKKVIVVVETEHNVEYAKYITSYLNIHKKKIPVQITCENIYY